MFSAVLMNVTTEAAARFIPVRTILASFKEIPMQYIDIKKINNDFRVYNIHLSAIRQIFAIVILHYSKYIFTAYTSIGNLLFLIIVN